jgi:hypothetical protein
MKGNSPSCTPQSIRHRTQWQMLGGFISLGLLSLSQQIAAMESPSFRERVLATYNFAPHSLTKEEISGKSRQLDIFLDRSEGQSSHGSAGTARGAGPLRRARIPRYHLRLQIRRYGPK